MELVGNSWDNVLDSEYHKDYFKKIVMFINKAYKERDIFPPKGYVLRALSLTDYDDVKVVILGQDPYHGVGEANGLSFSVREGVKMPPSLANIFKELEDDLGIKRTKTDLSDWAYQGVLLLNSILTVEKDKPLSHSFLNWEKFTDAVIKKLSDRGNVIFVLWGSFARNKKVLINTKKNYIIESVHPSPLSCYRGFFGSKPFSKTNEFLEKNGEEKINWDLN